MADTSSTLADLGIILSNAAGGRAAGRKTAADLAQDSDRINVSRYLAQLQGGNQDLQQRAFALKAPGQRANNAAQGDILAGAQDASISGLPSRITMPTVSGGLRPSLFSDNTRQLGKQMSRDALLGQMNGDKFTNPQMAGVNPLPQESALDKILGAGGLGSSLLSALTGGGKDGNGASGNISKLISDIIHRNDRGNYPIAPGDGFSGPGTTTISGRDPNGGGLPGYDEGDWNVPDMGGANGGSMLPTGPAGGGNTGPGMQDYYDWLAHNPDQGGGEPQDPYGTNPWDE